MSTPRRTLKRRNILLMILFTVATLGVYFPIWYLRRRAALNALDSPRKVPLWPFLVVIAHIGVSFILGVTEASLAPGEARFSDSLGFTLMQLGVTVLVVWQNFRVKDIIEDHLTNPDAGMPLLMQQSVSLSGVLTFILGMFYLQHAINQHLEALTRTPDGAAAGSAQ